MSELEDPRTLTDCNQRLPHEVARGCGFLDLHTFLLPGREMSDLFTRLELAPIVMCTLAHLASAALRRRLLDDLIVAEAQETVAAVAASAAAAAAAAEAAVSAAAAVTMAASRAVAPAVFTETVIIPGPSAWHVPTSPKIQTMPCTYNTAYDSPQPWTMTRRSASSPHITQSIPCNSTDTHTLENHLPASHQSAPKLASSPPQSTLTPLRHSNSHNDSGAISPTLTRLRHSTSNNDSNSTATSPQLSTLARLRHSSSHVETSLAHGARLSPTLSSGGAMHCSGGGTATELRSSLSHLTTRPLGLHTRNYSLPGMPSYDDFGSSSDGDDITHADNGSTSAHPSARLPGAFVTCIPRSTRATSDGVITISQNNSLVRFLDLGSHPAQPLVLPPILQLGWTEAQQDRGQHSCRTTRSSAIRSTTDIWEVQEAYRAAEEQQCSEVQQMCDDLLDGIDRPQVTQPANAHTTAANQLDLPRILTSGSSGDTETQAAIMHAGNAEALTTETDRVWERGVGIQAMLSVRLGTADQRERRDVVLAMSKAYNTIVCEDTDEGNLCDVCYDRPEQVTMDRCGHRLCRSCSTKITALMQESPLLCPFCRAVVRKFACIPFV